MTEKLCTIDEYVAAFETWSGVRRLGDDEARLLTDGLAHLRGVFFLGERPIGEYCDEFDAYLASKADYGDDAYGRRGGLRLTINKSCLLDRLLYVGEPLRTVKCPKHEGRWSGCQPEYCDYGCNAASCGCTTGWLPSLDRLKRAEAKYVDDIAKLYADGSDLKVRQARIWEKRLVELRGAIVRVATIPGVEVAP